MFERAPRFKIEVIHSFYGKKVDGELSFTYTINIKITEKNMSHYKKLDNLEKALKGELEVLNDVIDKRIIRGLSYAREARRHKFILSRIQEIKRESRSGTNWLVRSFSLI